jgi:hypothetical protein
MTKYIEKYEVPGDSFYGIEDYADGQPDENHFFPDNYKKGNSERFMLWRGGCGIGQASTLQMARTMLFKFIRGRLQLKQDKLLKETNEVGLSLGMMGTDYFNLGEFKVRKFQHEKVKK